jgi:phosphoglycerate dehydrogenase-like enzyme
VLDDYQDIARRFADWSQLPPEAEVDFLHRHFSEEEAVAALQDYEILIAQRERMAYPRSLLERLPNLKVILGNGRLNPFLDLKAAQELGIRVINSSGFPAPRPERPPSGVGVSRGGGPTGELTWALMISLMRGIPQEAQSVRDGGWQTTTGPELAGKTLGIVGLGNIGTGVARVALIFGMDVIAWSQNLTPERAAEHGVTAVSKDELFRRSDIVTIHYSLSARSRGIVGAHEIGLMKPTAYFVNTARGPLVDEAALIEALRERRIAGAALDVFDQEPLPPDHPFRTLDNVLCTPHIGYGSDEGNALFQEGNVKTLLAYFAGEPLNEYQLTE